VLGKAATGSGKTLAFGLPLLARIGADAQQGRRAPRGLVLVPTRELAQQVHDALAPLGQAMGLQLATVYGGAPMYRQIQQLRRGVDVIIATPGRLQDLISQGEATLAEVVVTVLDEADFMADLGFLPVVKELLDQTDRNAQRLLFSATLDGEVDSLVRRYLKDPARHEVVRPGGEAPPAEHLAFSLAFRDKLQVATELAGRPGRTLIFARTHRGVDRLAENLKAAAIKVEAIHGGLPQAARLRADWGRPPWIASALIPAAFRFSASRSTPSCVRAKMIVRPGRPASSVATCSLSRKARLKARCSAGGASSPARLTSWRAGSFR
jgi:superfamily II DNA/RNA helicase